MASQARRYTSLGLRSVVVRGSAVLGGPPLFDLLLIFGLRTSERPALFFLVSLRRVFRLLGSLVSRGWGTAGELFLL